MLSGRVVLPVASVYVAWQAEGLPGLHRALMVELDVDGEAIAEGDLDGGLAVFRGGWAALEQHGLARGRRVRDDFARALRLIAEASTEFYAFFNHGDEPTRSALVVVSGEDALRVVVTPDRRFVLEPVRADDAAQALIAALPEAPPGRGRMISLPADALSEKPTSSDEGGGSFLQANRPVTTPHQQQVQELRRLLAAPRLGGGQLYACRRDRHGNRVRSAAPVTYFDTPAGRYLHYRVEGNGGTWMTVQPADFTTMAGRLGALATA